MLDGRIDSLGSIASAASREAGERDGAAAITLRCVTPRPVPMTWRYVDTAQKYRYFSGTACRH